jgi:hypothetical protein
VDDLPMKAEPAPTAVANLREVLERARTGDPAALADLRETLRSRPDLVEYCGNLAAFAERAWVDLAAGPNLVVHESLKIKLEGLRAELAGPDSTPLERLAVDRVAITWLQAGYGDVAAAGLTDVPPRVAGFALDRQDRAHKRHLAALAALSLIHRLRPRGGRSSSEDGPGRGPQPGGPPGTATDLERVEHDKGNPALSILHPEDRDAIGPARRSR